MDIHAIYLQAIINVFMPFIFVLFFVIYFLIILARKKYTKPFNFFEKTMSTLTISLFMAQPSIFNSIFLLTDCVALDPGTSYIKTNLDESCLSNFYLDFYQRMIIPTFFIFGILLPLISFCFMVYHRKKIFEKKSNIRNYFGFLLNGYKNDKFYW